MCRSKDYIDEKKNDKMNLDDALFAVKHRW